MRLIFAYLSCCRALLLFYRNGSITCDGSEIFLPNITFCNSYALGTKNWVYNGSQFLQSTLEIVAYHKTAQDEEFILTKNNTQYYVNNVYFPELISAVPGFLAYDHQRNTLCILGINTLTIQQLGYIEFDRNLIIIQSFIPIYLTTSLDLYATNQSAMVLALKNSAYHIYKATTGGLRFLVNTTDAAVVFNRTTINITLIPVVDGVVKYCGLECSNLAELINSTNWASTVDTSAESSSTEYTTSITSSTIPSDISISTTLNSYRSSVLLTTKWFDTSTSISSPSVRTTTTTRSSSMYSSSKPDQFIITVWSTQEIHRVGFTPLNIAGQFVIPDQSILRLDLSEVDFSVGDSIVLFTFSSHQGSFSGLELLGYSSCLDLGAHLEESETQLVLVFTTSSMICAGTIKQIM